MSVRLEKRPDGTVDVILGYVHIGTIYPEMDGTIRIISAFLKDYAEEKENLSPQTIDGRTPTVLRIAFDFEKITERLEFVAKAFRKRLGDSKDAAR